jgi:hypothetical protein
MTAEQETTELTVLDRFFNELIMVIGYSSTVNLTKSGAASPAHGFTSGFFTPSFIPGGFLQGMWRALKRHFFILCPPCYPVSNGRGLFGGVA